MSVLQSICNTALRRVALTSFFVFFTLGSMMDPDEHQFLFMKQALLSQLLTAEDQQLHKLKNVIDQEFHHRRTILMRHTEVPGAYAIIHHTTSRTGYWVKKYNLYPTIQPVTYNSKELESYAEKALVNFVAACIDPFFTAEDIYALKEAAPTELMWPQELYYWHNGMIVATLKFQESNSVPAHRQNVLIFPLTKKMILWRDDNPINAPLPDDTTENLDHMIIAGINE